MPAQQSIRSTARPATQNIPLNGHYPKYLTGSSGSVWLMTAPKTGVLVVLERQPFRNKAVAVGYSTSKLKESTMTPFKGSFEVHVD